MPSTNLVAPSLVASFSSLTPADFSVDCSVVLDSACDVLSLFWSTGRNEIGVIYNCINNFSPNRVLSAAQVDSNYEN